jgi:hypothetical protein
VSGFSSAAGLKSRQFNRERNFEKANFDILRFAFNVVSYKRRLWPKKAASQIEKETDERRTSNVQHRTSNNVFFLP